MELSFLNFILIKMYDSAHATTGHLHALRRLHKTAGARKLRRERSPYNLLRVARLATRT